jgi:hypothetical protein
MALLYVFRVNHSDSDSEISNFPPSMDTWANTLATLTQPHKILSADFNTTSILFADETALKVYTDSIKLTAPQQAAIDEWKAAHGISYTHTVYNLPEVTVTGINWIS